MVHQNVIKIENTYEYIYQNMQKKFTDKNMKNLLNSIKEGLKNADIYHVHGSEDSI